MTTSSNTLTYSFERVQETATWIKSQIEKNGQPLPSLGLVLGSGLGSLAEQTENTITMPYEEVPHFPISTIEGHAGELVYGTLENEPVLLMNGRFHMYEGYDAATVVYPIRVMKELGISALIITNASGGIKDEFEPGDLMLIEDHLNLTSRNPLVGPNDDRFGPRFPDMSEAYSRKLRKIAEETATEVGIHLQKGIYVGILGPSYETPAEIRMFRALGGDAVGMSTVTEVIAAQHAGMEVLGISCISNMAAGMLEQPLSHEEVMETTARVKTSFQQLVRKLVPKIAAAAKPSK